MLVGRPSPVTRLLRFVLGRQFGRQIWATFGFAALVCAGCHAAAPLPPKALELNRLGAQALAQGDLETAGARLNLALEYNPRFVEALTNLGIVELQRGNFERAHQLLERARRLNPDIAQPHHGLGVVEERRGNREAASEHYLAALAVDPGLPAPRLNLARLYFEASMLEHARIQFKRLVEAAPEMPAAHAGLAETLVRLGREREGEAIADRAWSRFPESPELLLLGARSALRRGDAATCLNLLAPLATRRDAFGVSALAWMATAELAAGRPRRAAVAAERALSRDPNEPVAIYAFAVALKKLGHEDAAKWWQRAERVVGPKALAEARKYFDQAAARPSEAPREPTETTTE